MSFSYNRTQNCGFGNATLKKYGRMSFRPPLPFHLPHHQSLTMLKSEHVLTHLSNKNGGSSMGIYDLSEEMRSEFGSTYQPAPLLAPRTSQQHLQVIVNNAPGRRSVASNASTVASHSHVKRTHSNVAKTPPSEAPQPAAQIRYPDFDQWLQTAGNIGYVTSVMLARSKSESTLSEMSDMTNNRRRLFTISKKSQRKANYQDLGKSELREGIRQHHVALLRWTNLVGRLSKQLSAAFGEFSRSLEQTTSELRSETEKTNQMFRSSGHVKHSKPSFVLGRTLDKIWLTVLDNVSDQARIFGDLSKTLTHDFSPSFTDVIEHHQKFIGQIYAFECGLENLLSEYRQTTEKSFKTCEMAKQMAIHPVDSRPLQLTASVGSLPFAVDSQNAYVLNLHNYNTMISQYENSLMPILVEELNVPNTVKTPIVEILHATHLEMEDASTDLMTYGVKFLDAITQLVGKRYGELKGRMEVVEFACRYQTKARSDISAYVRAFLDARRHTMQSSRRAAPANTFRPFALTPSTQLLAMEETEHKLSEMADALSEEIYDMADLRRTKQAELEHLEEKYHACLSNVNLLASSGNGPSVSDGGSGASTKSKAKDSSAKEVLPSFSTVTFTLKANIADSKRMVALATAKLNSLKHQMDLLSAARRQPPPSSVEAEFEEPVVGAHSSPPTRLPHQSGGGGVKQKHSLRKSLNRWFSFLAVSNGSGDDAAGSSQARGLSSKQKQYSSAGGLSAAATSVEDQDHYEDAEYHPNFGADDAAPVPGKRMSKAAIDDSYYHATYDHYGHLDEQYAQNLEAPVDDEEMLNQEHEGQSKQQKVKIFSVKGFKKTIDRLRRITSEDNTSELPSRRRRNPHRTQSNEPDPVYALLKCAATLRNVNLETHATNCQCDECPARRLVSGVSTTVLPASMALALPARDSPSLGGRRQQLQPQLSEDQLMQTSVILADHPAHYGNTRNRLSSLSMSSGAATSKASPNAVSHGMVSNRSSMIVMPSSQPSQPMTFYQHQTSLTNLRR